VDPIALLASGRGSEQWRISNSMMIHAKDGDYQGVPHAEG